MKDEDKKEIFENLVAETELESQAAFIEALERIKQLSNETQYESWKIFRLLTRRNPARGPSVESGQIESNEPFPGHTKVEDLELQQIQLYSQLKAAVSDIPEGTSQRAEADGILNKFSARIGKQTRALVTTLALLSPLTVSGEVRDDHTEHINSTEIQINYS